MKWRSAIAGLLLERTIELIAELQNYTLSERHKTQITLSYRLLVIY